jgi:hypothetical protein
MKVNLLVFLIIIGNISAHANTQSLQFLRQGVLYNCDPENPPQVDENWVCQTEETGRTGKLFQFGCSGSDNWACLVTVKESCTETNSGRQKNRSHTEFRGCSSSLQDCW